MLGWIFKKTHKHNFRMAGVKFGRMLPFKGRHSQSGPAYYFWVCDCGEYKINGLRGGDYEWAYISGTLPPKIRPLSMDAKVKYLMRHIPKADRAGR